MNIAVVLSNIITGGGGFQQELATILLLNSKRDYYNFYFFTTKKKNIAILKENGIEAYSLYNNVIFKIIDLVISLNFFIYIRRKLNIINNNFIDIKLNKKNIDLVYFLSSCEEAISIENHNFIITVWDLCHRDNTEFPEVTHFRRFETRELLYSRVLPKAIKIIADSPAGAQNILRKYNVDESRVISVPFTPSVSVLNHIFSPDFNRDVINKYKLPEKYIFYPAQFWPHKNHSYILDGLKILREKFKTNIFAVFCGSDKGNLGFILQKAKSLGIDDLILNLGFIENEEIPYLYRNSIALVMPSYFGPTNIPPIEAFILECPVLYSDLPYMNQQLNDAVFYLNLNDPESMALTIISILNDKEIVKEKLIKGKALIEELKPENVWKKLESVFESYKLICKTWKQF
jgi:glycosyltransferase involved in cell wall biosynthesis